MRTPWCEMFQAYAPASPNATRSPARSRLTRTRRASTSLGVHSCPAIVTACPVTPGRGHDGTHRSEEHTSELQSQSNLVCRLLLEKKKKRSTEEHDADVNHAR